MARPRTITDEQIIEAARLVFMRDGVSAATSAVAREAGVSEGTIFKRFPTKSALFQRAMGCTGVWKMELVERIGQGDARAQLIEVTLGMIEHLRVIVPRIMALASHMSFSPEEFWREHPNAAPLVALERITEYLGAEMAAGRLRRGDPEIAARVLMGTTYNFAFFEHIGMHLGAPRQAEDFAEELVEVLWLGLGPEPRGGSGE